MSWRRSWSPAFCDQSTINSGGIIGGGNLLCQSGCSGSLGGLHYRCTDFSASEDWSFGENRYSVTFNSGSTIRIGFASCCWISPFSSSWNIATTFSTSTRSDNGLINSTPRAVTAPVIRLLANCDHTIGIITSDPDNDLVRCRWAVGSSECGGICSGFPGAVLDSNTCTITYTANRGTGFKAAAIMIEDFIPGSNSPMSSVALQFLVLVFSSSSSCSAMPEFISPTYAHGTCIAVPSGGTFTTRLAADSGGSGISITDIQTISPVGLQTSGVSRIGQTTSYYVDATWTPQASQQFQTFAFCYTAINSVGLPSSQLCVNIAVGNTSPAPVTTAPNGQVIDSNNNFFVTFDANFTRPQSSAYITFHELDTAMEVYRIDASVSLELTYGITQLLMIPNYTFEENKQFYVNFDAGIVEGLEGCRPGPLNAAITSSTFWGFHTADMTPPLIHFLVAPNSSSSDIFLSWGSNEDVTWQCELTVGSQHFSVSCSDATWNGVGLSDGTYQLAIVATDVAGNTAQMAHTFIVDDTPPIAFITTTPAAFSNQQTFQFQFSCNEICSFECQLLVHGDSTQLASSPCNSQQYTTPTLDHGRRYTFFVEATDQVGNAGNRANFTWETDFEVPFLFGVKNSSFLCTDNTSTAYTGEAEATDNATAVDVGYIDYSTACFIQRTWRAEDMAGNVNELVQYIVLEYSASLSLLPFIAMECDSSNTPLQVPTNTAKFLNPCGRPLQLIYEDSGNNYTCPDIFTRTWTITDECDQSSLQFSQNVSLYAVCPQNTCGRNEAIPHGACILGGCVCSDLWYGNDCSMPILAPQVEPVSDVILLEAEDYSETLSLVQGTPLLTWTLVSAPNQMVLSQVTGEILWHYSQVGNFTIAVQVSNLAGQQTVSWSLCVLAGYSAFLHPVLQSVFAKATHMQLIGYVEYIEGNIVQDLRNNLVPVSVDVTSHNATRVINTYTDRNGSFSILFYPTATEYGSYVAGARHPGFLIATEQTGWDFLGFRASPSYLELRDFTVAEYRKMFYNVTTLINDGPRDLNDLTSIAILGNTQGLGIVVTLNDSSLLQPGESTNVHIQVETVRDLDANFQVEIKSMENVTVRFTVALRIAQILPSLVVSPPSINATISRATLQTIELNVTNIGSSAAHKVRAVLPLSPGSLISLVSFGNDYQQTEGNLTLESGEFAILSILLRTSTEQLLEDTSGEIIITSIEIFHRIQFNFVASSNVLVNFTVVVEDEYTCFAEGQPLVADAVVTLVNNQHGIQETRSTTEGNGFVKFFNIPEDRYKLFVNGPSHIPASKIVTISSLDPVYTVFLARRTVMYAWTAVPSAFEEAYAISLEAVFETHVPIPVVTITPRELSLGSYELGSGDMYTIQYNITNHGLITADNLRFELPGGHPSLEFSTEFLHIGSLDALTSIIVPVQVTRKDEHRSGEAVPCVPALFYEVGVTYNYICGTLQIRSASAVLLQTTQFPVCTNTSSVYSLLQAIPPAGRHQESVRGNDVRPSLYELPYKTPTNVICNKCIASTLACIPLNFRLDPCFPTLLGGTPSFDVISALSWIGCMGSVFDNFFPTYSCLPSVLEDCFSMDFGDRLEKREVEDTIRDLVEAFYPTYHNMLLAIEILGDEGWIEIQDLNWLTQVLYPALSDGSDIGTLISETEFIDILDLPLPNGTTSNMVEMMLERVNNTLHGWNTGVLEPSDSAEMNMASYTVVQNYSQVISEYNDRTRQKGYDSYLEAYASATDQYDMIENVEEIAGICAVVSIRIEQGFALTRESFLGTLEIENREPSSLEQLVVEIIIREVISGALSTDIFSISTATLSGSLTSYEEGWNLPSSESGTAEWSIIPYSEAAATESVIYNVGGKLSYITNGLATTVLLLPARIIVMPDPLLTVHYFFEKYVVGDNPLTETIEASVPFVLAVAVQNTGYGTAMDFHITSGQPKIVDNEQGLAVSFKIIDGSIDCENIDPSLSVEFGDIFGNTSKVVRWMLVASLQGEFMQYSASFEYMNTLGDQRLSSYDELLIHEIIHNVNTNYQSEEVYGCLDFLVKDQNHLLDFPNALYSSRTLERFNVTTGEVISVNNTGLQSRTVITVSNSIGWVYFRYEDAQNLLNSATSVINVKKHQNSLMLAIPSDNAWITNGVQNNVGTTHLHIFDYIEQPGVITLTFDICIFNCPSNEQPFEPSLPPGMLI